MKWIYVCSDKFACIDDEDWSLVSEIMWWAEEANYVRMSQLKPKPIYLHRYLLNPPDGMVVDHINGNPLDNRRCNMRVVTPAENSHNSDKSGVHFDKRKQKWIAQCSNKWLGHFKSEAEAEVAYRKAALERSGTSYFARPEIPPAIITDEEKERAITYREALKYVILKQRAAKVADIRRQSTLTQNPEEPEPEG